MYNSQNYMYNQMPMMSQQQPQQQFNPFNPFFPFPQNRSVIDAGSAVKNRTGELNIRFNRRFSSPPIVIVTSYWKGQGSQVSFVDTVTRVNRNGFTVVSDNAASNYYVNWVAVLPE
ncbi:H-type lectin domain-containing protein [Desulfonispora thiosulfatigenes DSM 11270]|uniref:H-type lectin domain-containing protein n=1 Tax=Desulfonispora thiosulfatigenes DSM 11270 TaxID=656914 RepID=A0A1W1V1Z9_DESTI|nr:hypothetical protein [Desulfonispora thiosulfatigenes]SMB87328.1 H-type lectin domain-containing protein [Desulfonispora thiosulfatigenes DSM 11270]